MHAPSPEGPLAGPLDTRAALTAWHVEPALVAGLALAAVVYVRGWRRLHACRPARIGGPELVAWLGGLAALFVALASPLDTLGDRLLAVHMAQHLVLIVVAPVLLLWGAPVVPLLHGLPAGSPRALIGGAAIRVLAPLGHPAVGWCAMTLALWGWHAPAAFELALRSRAWHVVEHLSFLVAGLLFWWPVVRPWPYRARWPEWASIPYLLSADVQNTALAALLIFSDRVVYPSYGRGPDALADQIAAGLLMWVPMSLAYLVPAAVITVRWLSPARGGRTTWSRPAPREPVVG